MVGSIADYERELGGEEEATLSGYLERVSLVNATDALDGLATVSLMTVHSAKGLEFRSVFITGMEEEIFPYSRVSHEEPEEIDEERRLAYVAITRARERLFIVHAGMRTLFGKTRYSSPSRFLRDLPDDTISREGTGWAATPYATPYTSQRATSLPVGTRVVERIRWATWEKAFRCAPDPSCATSNSAKASWRRWSSAARPPWSPSSRTSAPAASTPSSSSTNKPSNSRPCAAAPLRHAVADARSTLWLAPAATRPSIDELLANWCSQNDRAEQR
jgi:ATP-dependent exoDNAse (exonuclease V) beta subunit